MIMRIELLNKKRIILILINLDNKVDNCMSSAKHKFFHCLYNPVDKAHTVVLQLYLYIELLQYTNFNNFSVV